MTKDLQEAWEYDNAVFMAAFLKKDRERTDSFARRVALDEMHIEQPPLTLPKYIKPKTNWHKLISFFNCLP